MYFPREGLYPQKRTELMAEYNDKVVNADVDVLSDASAALNNGDGGLVTLDSASIVFAGAGTSPSPLQASVAISRKTDNGLQVISSGTEQGIFVKSSEVKISAKEGNQIKNITADDAAGQGNPALEGICVDPLTTALTSPNGTVSIKADIADKSKATIDVKVLVDSDNALVSTADGMKVGVSKSVDNILEIRSGDLYVAPQNPGISQATGNKIELKSDGIFVESIKGDQGLPGVEGPTGTQGQGVIPKGELESWIALMTFLRELTIPSERCTISKAMRGSGMVKHG